MTVFGAEHQRYEIGVHATYVVVYQSTDNDDPTDVRVYLGVTKDGLRDQIRRVVIDELDDDRYLELGGKTPLREVREHSRVTSVTVYKVSSQSEVNLELMFVERVRELEVKLAQAKLDRERAEYERLKKKFGG